MSHGSRVTVSPYWWLLALSVAHVLFTLFVNVPGYLTWDSGTYHLMVRTLLHTGSFFIDNDYESIASPLLAVAQTVPHGGHLVSQYPEYYTFLALPFFAVFGFQGFTVLNSLAFFGTCALIWRIARWFSPCADASVAAVVIYAMATFAWEFTQSSYPHLTSTFLVVLACWLAWGAWLEQPETAPDRPRRGLARYALAGLVFGIAVGVRLDSLFGALALGVILIHGGRIRWTAGLAMFAGALPAVLGLAWINLVKFGAFSPITYGRAENAGNTASILLYLPVAAIVVALIALYVFQARRKVRLERKYLILLGLAAGAGLVFLPFGQRFLHGVFQLVVDLRIRPLSYEPALSRSPGNAVVYFGNVKKALLESSPYLVLIILPALSGLLRGSYGVRWLLWLVPLGFIGFYGFFAWHGSVGLNMRYFNPALPFLAILASHEWLRLRPVFVQRRILYGAGIVVAWCVSVFFLLLHVRSLEQQETYLLNVSLALAGALAILQIARYSKLENTWIKRCMAVVFLFSLIWSSAVVLSRDYMMSRSVRGYFLNAAVWTEEALPQNAVILTHSPDMTWVLLDRVEGLTIAGYLQSPPEETVRLARHYLGNRPLFMTTRADPAASAAYSEQITQTLGATIEQVKKNPSLDVTLFRIVPAR